MTRQLLMELSTTVISAHSAPYKLARICISLHDAAHFHAGVESLITSSATSRIGDSDKTFEDAIREYQLEEQGDIEASESGGP
ncbi:hypothetical protein AZE42_03861 [Rhizopogon vesiculosus]|uniref:Uncharacterized protein n=1 Tax=Rhizopogon vesiculosus TaxID=180088 RepID=A0A1J8QD73_9AGAM|nr:hypothetical protein AZE42_03861 [Rhizopogon vesiculosus]